MLSEEQLLEYKVNGCLVIPNVLSDKEVLFARKQLHEQLMTIGIDQNKILSAEVKHTEGPRLKSKVAQIFYAKWKLDVMLHPCVCQAFEEVMQATYQSSVVPHFEHPFGASDSNSVFIDRICWRLPDVIRAEEGLGLHLDQNPFHPYDNLSVFRPIQGFVALTDHFDARSGGINVVKRFHLEASDYFKKGKDNNSIGGGFYRMNAKVHAKLWQRCEPLFAPKGTLVLWDNRLPHSTSDFLDGNDTREVVYCSFLPNVDINQKYVADQLKAICANIPPPLYINPMSTHADRNWLETDFTSVQQRYLGYSL